ncbi:hypothetical protein OS493_024782 [Desmophyllum pertusum]|uniref:Uncharacterized protein n=1 Tax=Desmophyllum pertusum TaxID=174260 RepID=A0A9X0CW13_9CNID|nr:hypothetical protein OS493_024782 [Desmophyllum pertusum]
MSPLQFKFFSALAVIHLVLVFDHHSVKADFSDSCVNSTNSTSSVPDKVLGILSLGSILVYPRTQNLSIQIPLFCCNVSEKEDERRTLIKEMIEGALAALQDLAIKPGIRDPRLNTAECVIEGHEMDIDATGRKGYIWAILCFPVCFVFVSCPLLANFLEEYRKLAWPTPEENKKTNKSNGTQGKSHGDQNGENKAIFQGNTDHIQEHDGSQEKEEKNKNKKNTAVAAVTVCILSFVLAAAGILILIIAFGFSICYCVRENAPLHIAIIIPLILIESLIVFGVRKCTLNDVARYSIFFTICANVTSYHSCWLLIGIMINPTWGLTVTLLTCFTFATIGFAVYEYNYNEVSNKDQANETSNKDQARLSCGLLVSAAFFLLR